MTINLLANAGFPLPRESQDVLFREIHDDNIPVGALAAPKVPSKPWTVRIRSTAASTISARRGRRHPASTFKRVGAGGWFYDT